MTIQKLDYPGIGETLYSAVLDNGLEVRVVPKKDFSTSMRPLPPITAGRTAASRSEGKAILPVICGLPGE